MLSMSGLAKWGYIDNIKFYEKALIKRNWIIQILIEKMGIGDWGLGIGDWAQSPIPNPQSPIPNNIKLIIKILT